MDARVKPAHDTGCVVGRTISPANISSANASLSRGFDFGPRGGPFVPVFRFPSKRGEWSAGRRLGSLTIGSLRPVCETSLCVALPGPKSLEGGGDPGTHGPFAKGPAPPDAPSAVRVVGGRTLLRHPVSRSTTPSIEQGMADIDQDARIAKLRPPVCKLLQHLWGKPMSTPRTRSSSPGRRGAP